MELPRGFLPTTDPIHSLPENFSAWEQTAKQLPKLLVSDGLRQHIQHLPAFDTKKLVTPEQINRAMLLLSYLGHAYVWGEKNVADKIPAVLAQPWCAIAQQLQRPPVLSYASYALYNWYRLDKTRPIELGNIALLQNFLGGIDEEWFILIHVDIEAKAAIGLSTLLPAQESVAQENTPDVIKHLKQMAATLKNMCEILDRMPEHCDPYIYYHRVRPYIHGWKNNPSLPKGLIYEGVAAFNNQPQQFKGETGAQSTIIPSFDAALGIEHENDLLKAHLDEMRDYMPREHVAFLEQIEKNSSIRPYVKKHAAKHPELKDLYNECVTLLGRFRHTHLSYAHHYIQQQAQSSDANPTEIGTGGTPFMAYLKKHLDVTKKFLV